MIKKFWLSLGLSLVLVLGFLGNGVARAVNQVDLHLFYGNTCPHCAKEKTWLEGIKQKYPNLKVHLYEVYEDKENQDLVKAVAEKINISMMAVPLNIIADQVIIGFSSGEIEEAIKYYSNNSYQDIVSSVKASIVKDKAKVAKQKAEEEAKQESEKKIKSQKSSEKIVKIPLLGRINIMKYSLLAITVILGLADGFNPCAVWALVFLMGLLIGIGDRRRMWLLGGVFIFVSALVYFLILSTWLNTFLFLGSFRLMSIGIGLLAVGGGAWSIYSSWKQRNETSCKITASAKRQTSFNKMRQWSQSSKLLLAVGGIAVLAVTINLVEFFCSVGAPATFTQVLASSGLATWQRYAYILIYTFFFMLDDMIVFAVAMATLKIANISTKYAKISGFIGGVIMLVIGFLLLFRPEWLSFK